jgi:hypothetical protein
MMTDLATNQMADDLPSDSTAPCSPRQCAVTIRNAEADAVPIPPATKVGFRVILRALILGIEDARTSWVNTYRLDGSGIRDVRRLRYL